MLRRLVTKGKVTPEQHMKSCFDCPWGRNAVPGWLGNMSAENWLKAAHGGVRIDCHVHLPHQCAGAATYRANVLKKPRDPALLLLAQNKERCFATPAEFTRHHAQGMKKA